MQKMSAQNHCCGVFSEGSSHYTLNRCISGAWVSDTFWERLLPNHILSAMYLFRDFRVGL